MGNNQELLHAGAIQKIAQFFKQYGYYDVSYDQLLWAIGEHLKYGTIEIVRDNNEIIAFCRYNLSNEYCDILDVVIRPDWRRKHLLQAMILNGFKKWNGTKWKSLPKIRFKRGLVSEKTKEYDMLKFLKGLK